MVVQRAKSFNKKVRTQESEQGVPKISKTIPALLKTCSHSPQSKAKHRIHTSTPLQEVYAQSPGSKSYPREEGKHSRLHQTTQRNATPISRAGTTQNQEQDPASIIAISYKTRKSTQEHSKSEQEQRQDVSLPLQQCADRLPQPGDAPRLDSDHRGRALAGQGLHGNMFLDSADATPRHRLRRAPHLSCWLRGRLLPCRLGAVAVPRRHYAPHRFPSWDHSLRVRRHSRRRRHTDSREALQGVPHLRLLLMAPAPHAGHEVLEASPCLCGWVQGLCQD
jgi:hypothetical protein